MPAPSDGGLVPQGDTERESPVRAVASGGPALLDSADWTGAHAGTQGVSGETPDLSGGTGGGASGGAPVARSLGAPGSGASGAGAGGGGAGGAGGIGGAGAVGGHILPVLIAGGLSGIVAMGALIALNVIPVHSGGSGASPRGLVLVACPGSGPVLAVVDPGEKLLVTGRSSDGSWLQVYLPGPALPYAWAPANELQPSSDTSGLPVTGCEIAAASPTATPIEATATPIEVPSSEEPTTKPTTKPTATPTPTPVPTPVNSSPIIAGLAASPKTVYFPWTAPGLACGPDAQDPDTTTISATITDPQGVASATLFFKLPGGAYTSKPMSRAGSTWSASVKQPSTGGRTGNVSYYIVSKDASAAGKTRTSPIQAVAVKKCDIPPTFTRPYAKPAIIYVPTTVVGAGPLCSAQPSPIELRTYATDVDNAIVKVVFWYTPYRGTRHSLNLTKIPSGEWYGQLTNAKFAKLPGPGPYTFSGYFIATDAAGRDSARTAVSDPPLTEMGCQPG